MSPPALPAPDLQHWLPATFRERGVAVPFTSPALAGARIRLLERRPDVIVPHPGGARGVYVFALASLAEFCVPTLHDFRLAARLATLPCLSPTSVRLASIAVAAEGAAGRPAAAAAAAAEAADGQRQSAFFTRLLAALEADTPATANERGVSQAVHQLARRTGRTPEAVLADISQLAAELARSALDAPPGPAAPGRGRVLLAAIATLGAEVQAWPGQGGKHPAAPQVVAAATAMQAAGGLVLREANKVMADPATLMRSWGQSQAGLAALVAQPDWMLDGWEHICLLWRICGSDEERAAALAEIALLLPPVPAEADAWFAGEAALIALLHARPPNAQAACVREPSQGVSLTARNERIRSLAA